MDYRHIEQLQKRAEYERAMSPQVGNSDGSAMQPPNQIKQPGLMDGLKGITERLDRLHQALGILEDRLSPLTGCPIPGAAGNQAQQQPEPAAIDEIARIILRLNSAVSTVESITNRVRI